MEATVLLDISRTRSLTDRVRGAFAADDARGIMPGMTLEQSRVFVAVAKRQPVTRSAASLNLTQLAAGSAITALEARHAAKLSDRVGRRGRADGTV